MLGAALDSGVQRLLENGYNVDLSAIRVHDDARADRLAHALGADAFTAGTHVFFRDGAYQPSTDAGMRLVAHEVAHAIQQAEGARPQAFWEYAADRAAGRLINGKPVWIGRGLDAVRPPSAGAPVIIQRHESFEHRALGDLSTADIVALTQTDLRDEIIERETKLMWLWHQEPEKVSKDDILALCPWMKDRLVCLQPSELLVTYGELNALPDYIANAQAIDSCPRDVMLPLLQVIRQESFQQFNLLRGLKTNIRFAKAPFAPSEYQIDLVNKIFASWGLDDLTRNLGIEGIDHYTGLLARNACHFAPFTWHRWQASYVMARGFAEQSYAEGDANEKARLKRLAWLYHGYADHFLQDSFAAGHLINKTLAMQWFIEWASNSILPVEDWDMIKNMTAAIQPGFAGRQLYRPTFTGASNDPQTVEENPTYDTRRAASGVQAYKIKDVSTDLRTAYQQYLTFLSSVIAQTTSNAIHDYYNENSLWVASGAHTDPFEVYGDDTLFTGKGGSDGAKYTSEAAHLSQQSISELLDNGKTDIKTEVVRKTFPSKAGDDAAHVVPLEQWVDSRKQWTIDNILETSASFWFKRIATQTFPRIVNLSQDQEFSNLWYTSLPNTGYVPVDVVTVGSRLFAGCRGQVFELDPMYGKILRSYQFAGGFETHIATDGKMVFLGCNGYAYGIRIDGDWKSVAWTAPMLGSSYNMVNVVYANGRLFAGSNTYAIELDPVAGTRKNSISVSSAVGPEVRLATDGTTLFIGCHGYAHAMRLNDWSKTVWTAGMPHASYSNVQLLLSGGALYAGSNGTAIQLNPATGERLHDLTVTSAVDEEVHLATDDKTLAVGCNGYVTGVNLSDWSKAAWATSMSGKGWKMVDVQYSNGVVYAGSNGYVHRLDLKSGKMLNAVELGYNAGIGDYSPKLTLNDRAQLFIGMHGYAFAMS